MNVNFDANQRISCQVITNIIDDSVIEADQCFSLVIVTPPGSDLVPGGKANVTIVDDDVIITSIGE